MRVRMLMLFLTAFLFVNAAKDIPAFPGAEGFGRYTTGGRGGKVYVVNTLEDNNEGDAATRQGSFRWCLNQSGTRTIVFNVSGTIHLKSALGIKNGNVTIAGQSAPGDGICVADYPFTINANNVIIRYMRFRLGNKQVAHHEGDGLGGMDLKNVIVDHCSVSWSIDECLSVYGSRDITVQWCLVSQSLNNSGHSKGSHGYGGNWGGSGASYHHNLMAHHNSRTPRLGPRQSTQTDERMDLRNNVIYNWAGNGCYGGEGMNVNIVNNYYKPGPGTLTRSTGIQQRIASINIRTTEYCQNSDGSWNGWYPMWHVWGTFYVKGNVNSKHDVVTKDNWTYGIYNQIDKNGNDGTFNETVHQQMKLAAPIDFVYTTTHTAEKAYEKVLAFAGASLHRDAVDELMVYDTREGKASYSGKNGTKVPGLIDSQDDIKPADAPADWSAWPTLQQTTPWTDSDGDGMPDEYETANGLNANDAADGNIVNAEGYTNLEVYLNGIVSHITEAQNAEGEVQGIMPDTTTYEPVRKDVVLTWALGAASCSAAAVSEPEDVLASTASAQTGFSLSSSTYSNVKFTKFQPSASTSSPGETAKITFTVSPKPGESFKPGTLSFDAVRCGTDGGSVDVYWINDEGKKTEITTALKPDRNNNYSACSYDFSEDNFPATVGDGKLVFYIYNLGNTKQIGLANVKLSGQIDQVKADALQQVQIENDANYYDLMGRKVLRPERGLYIHKGKKIFIP